MFKKRMMLPTAVLCIVFNTFGADAYSAEKNVRQSIINYQSDLVASAVNLSGTACCTSLHKDLILPSENHKVDSAVLSHIGKVESDSSAVLQDSTLLLDQIVVSAGLRNVNSSPLRLRTVDKKAIISMAPGKTFPELIGGTPGIYATSESGSYGDAKINIRGYKQENISVLLNGVPISGLTSSGMYWNNWMGLADATAKIQVQKGIGASMLSDNSVGGTINIITSDPVDKQGVGAGFYMTGYGLKKSYLSYSSGVMKNGWAVSAMASYVWGDGYVEATDVNSFAYLLSVSKIAGKKNLFNFTALGSPEKHMQRSYRLSYSEVEKYGVNYNKNWGYYKGEKKTLAENNYYKPYFTLSHVFKTSVGGGGKDGAGNSSGVGGMSLSVSSTAYLAIGDGGGLFPEYKDKQRQIISFSKDGHIDWDAVVAYNKEQGVTGNSAKNIISDYMAGHTQFGLKSSATLDISKNTSIEAGVHWQMYDKWEKERINDLLGADYWYEDYSNNSISGLAGRNPYKKVGDYIRTYNGQKINYFTFYLSGTAALTKSGNLLLTCGASLSESYIRRWDRYNYVEDSYSRQAHGTGGSLKAGLLFKASGGNSFYLNGGVYSRAPYPNIYFASGNNNISKSIKNENNMLGEAGFRKVGARGGFEATIYAAYWKNKSLMSNNYKPMDINEYRYLVTGLDAFHYGFEAEGFYNIDNFLKLNAYVSHGVWKWKNDVHATIYDNYSGKPISTIDVYSNGLHVGDAPQSQAGASAGLSISRLLDVQLLNKTDISLMADWSYNTRYWADFDPASRTNKDDKSDSYRIPSFHIANLKLNISLPGGITLFANINNLFNAKYIERSKDGSTHDRQTLTGYWGSGCSFVAGFSWSCGSPTSVQR